MERLFHIPNARTYLVELFSITLQIQMEMNELNAGAVLVIITCVKMIDF